LPTLIKRKSIQEKQVDKASIIGCYNFSTGAYDTVEGSFNGIHGTMMNNRSTKTYYIVSGTATFEIDEKTYDVEKGDILSVEPKSWLKIIGRDLKTLIITNPPFDPNDEEWKV